MSGFAQLLGSMISESGDAFVLTPVEYMIGSPLLPALHGGAVASFLEVAAKRALARKLPPGHFPKLISVNLQFLASARLDALVTTPKVRRVGRRIAVVHAEAFRREDPAAVCFAQLEFAVHEPIRVGGSADRHIL